MYDDSAKPPISSSQILAVLVIAIIVVMAGTIFLNGGFSAPTIEENTSDNDTAETYNPEVQYKLLGNNSYGTVTKTSGYGDASSDIRVALILGVDPKQKSANAIVPTIKNEDQLNYCYDIYIINTTSLSKDGGNANNNNNLTVNQMSESLASEFVVPDIINNNYNFTVDIHSTNDSNSYVFVPSDNTYTSKIVVDSISNNTEVGKYTPDSHSYTESISENIISYEIPSIVYVTREYYNNGISGEISSIIHAIDDFDFVGLFSSDDSTTSSDATSTTNSSVSSSNDTVEEYNNTITVSSTSSGNKEVN